MVIGDSQQGSIYNLSLSTVNDLNSFQYSKSQRDLLQRSDDELNIEPKRTINDLQRNMKQEPGKKEGGTIHIQPTTITIILLLIF